MATSPYLSEASINRMIAAGDTEQSESTGAMIALVPKADQALKFAIQGWEPSDELHVTLAFLGEAATYPEEVRVGLTETVRNSVGGLQQIKASLWGRAEFNPHTADAASVYLVEGDGLTEVRDAILSRVPLCLPRQHRWIPHMTIGYGAPISELTHAGISVTFDRVLVAFGGQHAYIDLGA